MFSNYIVIAWRNLVKNRAVSFINIFGLTLGLASAVTAILFAYHELTYESSHHNADRIAKIYLGGSFGVVEWSPGSFGPEGAAIEGMFPEVERSSITRNTTGIVRAGENLFIEERILLADSSFFSIFTIPFVSGSPSADPRTVMLSESSAMKFFGSSDPVNQSLRIEFYGERIDFIVTGVYRDLPSNTHLKADIIVPFSLANRFEDWRYNEYRSTMYNIYLLLNENAGIDDLNEMIREQYEIPVPIDDVYAFLMPVKDIHFRGTFSNNRGKFLALLIGGLFVLATSCFNYINLTNILYATRKKEIGIRKVNGATRGNVFYQFLVDTGLSTLVSYVLALLVLWSILPWFNTIMDTNIRLTADLRFAGIGLALFLATVALSGVYPALKFSATKTSNLLKDLVTVVSGRSLSRKLLTTFQFILAVIFIQMILVMDRQGKHLDNVDVTGYNSENVICLPGRPWGDLNTVRNELLANPLVETVTWGSTIPSFGVSQTTGWKDEDNRTPAVTYFYDREFTGLYGIGMASGRFFSADFPGDRDNSIVINRETAAELGYDDPLGQTVMMWGEHLTIIGVIDDYMSMPPIFSKSPALIRHSGDSDEFLIIRIRPDDRESTHRFITGVLSGFNPDYPVNIRYHDDVLYETEEASSFVSAIQLMQLFFLITIIASLIGLFGLSLFIARKNRKEVGIRKVFGATVRSVMMRISKELVIQIIIAILIATPVAMVITTGYLSVFQYRIEPGLAFFLAGGGIALVLVVLTVAWQTWRAANMNPTDILRYE